MFIQMDGVGSGPEEVKDEDEKAPPKNIMVLAATNRPWDLDEAMIRRLEKRIYIPLPEDTGRKTLFDINLKDVKVEDDVDYSKLLKQSKGYSGADIANVC